MNVDVLMGYIDYMETRFLFIVEDYKLKLIPCNPDKQIAYNLHEIQRALLLENSDEFIKDIIFDGICLDGRGISICAVDSSWIHNGVFLYSVKWLYVYNGDTNIDDIIGLDFVSQEINYLYDVNEYIKDDFKLEQGSIKNYTVTVIPKERTPLGSFKFNKNIVKIFGNIDWRKNYDSSNNLEIWSKLSLEFEKSISSMDELYKIVLLQKLVIDVLTYRTNNSFDTIEVYTYNGDGKKTIVGGFYINNKYTKEENYRNVKHLISFNNLPDIGKLYELLDCNKIYTRHICESSEAMKIYDLPRMLGILIAFERIVNWKYSEEELRNNDYIELLNRLNTLIFENENELCTNLSKESIRFKSTVKSILKPQVPFFAYVHKVMDDYPIISSIVLNVYGEELTPKLKSNIAERINKLRNDLAHGHMNIEFSRKNTKDVKLMEMIFYVLILSELDLSSDEIIKKIVWLFNIRPFFT